jgi:CRP-like cAMP-binding protein
MITTELLRRYPFFAGLNDDYKSTLAKSAVEFSVDEGLYFFHEGDILEKFYLVVEGTVAIVIAIPDRDEIQTLTRQLTGNLKNRDVTVSTVRPGNIFGWSALVPPHKSTAGAKAQTLCRVVSFDCEELHPLCDQDHEFGHLMTQKAAQVIRERLRDMRMESLAEIAI